MLVVQVRERTGGVANLNRAAGGAIAIAKDTKGEAVEGAQRYGLNDRSREYRDQK